MGQLPGGQSLHSQYVASRPLYSTVLVYTTYEFYRQGTYGSTKRNSCTTVLGYYSIAYQVYVVFLRKQDPKHMLHT